MFSTLSHNAEEEQSFFEDEFLRMRDVNNRLKTFSNWNHPNISKDEVSQSGFYCKGSNFLVACPFCKMETNLVPEDINAFEQHKRWAPQCNFVRSHLNDSSLSSYAPFKKIYENLENRLESYKTWPVSIPLRPKELAAAGFYYTGHSDQVNCFYCGGGLRDWKTGDDPWQQHARWFDKCLFLIGKKGTDYIQKVMTEACSIKENERFPIVETKIKEEGKNKCAICCTEEAVIAFVPCGHISTCADCAISFKNCIMCRTKIESKLRIYYTV
ncbi:ORF53 [Agrotis segetum granulovirus]|uniref:Iap-1 n=1 Tax=Agrotis segetum granulosis virus TaxID=10464 RepID=Q6QXJ6_GVAS|nr:iap-1 [Agrotis segetum granulovirus]AAS82685.1 ORF53 [Agrotis segetum granulovirus]AHN92102.1 iap-3 [Agrotis segetum granulovirus]AKN63337.1 iap-1 [Agrotis segetum granulovirus]